MIHLYTSWKPEKGIFTLNDVVKVYESNPQIKHTMVTSGGPTIHPELLKELCVIGKKYDHTITIETEGSEFVQTEMIVFHYHQSYLTPHQDQVLG